ncbi:MAG TPA: hypothetical protein VF401_01055 [Candidatus Saccharimonadales bacterium]
MSLALVRSRDIEVKTRAGIAATAAGPFHTFEIYGDGRAEDHPLHVATEAIEAIVTDPVSEADPVLSGLRRYLAGLRVEGEHVRGQFVEFLDPGNDGYELLRETVATAEGGEPISFLDYQIDRQDFIHMTNYVMTNTALHPEIPDGVAVDPRLPMVKHLRSRI